MDDRNNQQLNAGRRFAQLRMKCERQQRQGEQRKAPWENEKLSPRQRQTLRALLKGLSVKEAAREMNLSAHTVHLYVSALYKHFDVHSRAELLAKCLGGGRQRLLECGDRERRAFAADDDVVAGF